jgi:Kelch motif
LHHRHRDALRTEVAGGEVGGKIYVVGGFGGERALEVYDLAADRWSRGASIARALHRGLDAHP